ncbi:MAG: hypothetical protein AB7E37_07285 [Candidatus Altimarinota bacterium]
MKVKNLVKLSLSVITAGFLLSGCVGSQPLPISNLAQSNKSIDISKNSLPIKEQGGVMFNDELITDKLGNIYTYGTIGNELYYAITDTQNDKVLIKDSKGKILKEFPNLNTPTVSYGISISQNDDKSIYIYERYGNIYKSIQKFDGKELTTLIKNKDIYLNEYKVGKFMFVIPTNSLGTDKVSYQNIEIDKNNFISNKLEVNGKEWNIFPILVSQNNIIFCRDESIFSLNTVSKEIKVLANKNSKVQFLRNGYDYYLRILNNPNDVPTYSKNKSFQFSSKYIDLQTLDYIDISNSKLEQMKVGVIEDKASMTTITGQGYNKHSFLFIYGVKDIQKSFENENGLYIDNNNRKSGIGFIKYFE